MRAYVIGAEALHTEVVDKAVFLDVEHVLPNFIIRNVVGDETERDREPISFECAEGKWFENALKATAADL